MITKFERFENNKERFKVGEYAIIVPFNNQRVKIIKVTDNATIWIEDDDGNQAEFLIKDFIPEIEYNAKKYNLWYIKNIENFSVIKNLYINKNNMRIYWTIEEEKELRYYYEELGLGKWNSQI